MALQFLIFLIIPVLVPPIVIGIRVQESENLTILAPRGTLFPGEKVQFTCESKEEGILYWQWYRNGSSSPIPVTSISELHGKLLRLFPQLPSSFLPLLGKKPGALLAPR